MYAPAHLTEEEAARLPCAGVTAWSVVIPFASIAPVDSAEDNIFFYNPHFGAGVFSSANASYEILFSASVGRFQLLDKFLFPA